MRLFVALTLPARERQRIYKTAGVLRDREMPVRWVGAENYHVTLKFLGDVGPGRLEQIQNSLDGAAQKTRPFSVSFGTFGAFPSVRRPSVLWLGVEASPALRCLKQDIEFALAECGVERETRAFHPHITLGRSSEDGGAGHFRGLDEVVAQLHLPAELTVKKVDLVQSRLSKEGAKYSVVHSSPLGAS